LVNEGIPYQTGEPGAVHILAWATVADDYLLGYEGTRALVLKRFDRPTRHGGYRWVLTLVQHSPEYPRWSGPNWHFTEFPGDPPLELTDAQREGHEFYPDRPTDEQVGTFLRQARWALDLGTTETSLSNAQKVNITRTLTAGGVDTVAWRQVFERDVPPGLFPELRKSVPKK
jgi:hypothetical protein